MELLEGLGFALMLAVLMASQARHRLAFWASVAMMAAAVSMALISPYLDPTGLGLAAALSGLAVWLHHRPNQPAAWLTLLALAAIAMLHLFPGIHNPLWIAPQTLGSSSVATQQYLNLDKAWLGFALLLAWRHARPWRSQRRGEGLWALGLCLALLGLAAASPWLNADLSPDKWSIFLRWACVNLVLTCLVEETVFRHGIQRQLGEWWQHHHRHGRAWALVTTSLVFGLAHAGGGPVLVVLASLAGLAYGLAYRRHGLWGATLLHFGLNSAHFLLFTYPVA